MAIVGVVLASTGGWHWFNERTLHEWQLAEAALRRHDLAAAALHLNRYLEHKPGDAAAWFLASRTARRLGRFADAEQHLDTCQRLGGVTEATRLEWSLLRVQQGDLRDIHTRLRMTIAPEHPDAPQVLEALARGYLHCDRLLDHMEACHLWATLQPDHPWPWLWRGRAFEQEHVFHQALANYEKALVNAPNDREVRLALGTLLAKMRRADPAAAHFEHLLSQSAHDHEARLGLASCRIEQGKSADALALLEPLFAHDPVPPRGLFLRGKAKLELGDAATAESCLKQAVQRAPDDPEALYQLTQALRSQGKHDEAARLVPRLESLRQDLSRLKELIAIVARSPDDPQPRHAAGVLALQLGHADDGVRWLLGALRVRGDHRPTHAALAEHFRRQNDHRADFHARQAQMP